MKLKDHKDWGKLVERKEEGKDLEGSDWENNVTHNMATDEVGELSVSIEKIHTENILRRCFSISYLQDRASDSGSMVDEEIAKERLSQIEDAVHLLANTNIIKITKDGE